MEEIVGTVTRKGQVTVPAPIRRALGLKAGDRVAFTLENGAVRLVPHQGVVARTAGMLRGEGQAPSLTAEEERELVEYLIAEDVVERMGGQ